MFKKINVAVPYGDAAWRARMPAWMPGPLHALADVYTILQEDPFRLARSYALRKMFQGRHHPDAMRARRLRAIIKRQHGRASVLLLLLMEAAKDEASKQDNGLPQPPLTIQEQEDARLVEPLLRNLPPPTPESIAGGWMFALAGLKLERAMTDAACGDHLQAARRLLQAHELRHLADVSFIQRFTEFEKVRAAREAQAREKEEQRRKKSAAATAAAKAKHERHTAPSLERLHAWYAKNRERFPSAAQAATEAVRVRASTLSHRKIENEFRRMDRERRASGTT